MGASANDSTTPSPLPQGRHRLVFSDWICGLLMYSAAVRQLTRGNFVGSLARMSAAPVAALPQGRPLQRAATSGDFPVPANRQGPRA